MPAQNEAAEVLQRKLDRQEYVFAPGIYTAMHARLAEMAGLDSVAMSGGSTNIGLYGFFDGLLGMSEMAANAKRIANATDIPVIADADTGYGGVHNIQRTVHEYEDAGVAGFHIEDQKWPKRCGHAAGKQVVDRVDAEARIASAVDAKQYEETVVIARTDAYGSENGTWEEHVERGRLFADAGADLIYPEVPDTSREDAIQYADELHETHPDQKLAFNYSSNLKWTDEAEPLTFDELADVGYNYIFISLLGFLPEVYSVYEFFRHAAENSPEEAQFRIERELGADNPKLEDPTEAFFQLGNFEEYQAIEREYTSDADERYERSSGYQSD